WYLDLLELCLLGPVLGQWTTLSRYFGDVMAGEYVSTSSADDFHGDYLSERAAAGNTQPIGWFAQHVRRRRRLDTAWTLAAMQRGLAGRADTLRVDRRLAELEDCIESGAGDDGAALAET